MSIDLIPSSRCELMLLLYLYTYIALTLEFSKINEYINIIVSPSQPQVSNFKHFSG